MENLMKFIVESRYSDLSKTSYWGDIQIKYLLKKCGINVSFEELLESFVVSGFVIDEQRGMQQLSCLSDKRTVFEYIIGRRYFYELKSELLFKNRSNLTKGRKPVVLMLVESKHREESLLMINYDVEMKNSSALEFIINKDGKITSEKQKRNVFSNFYKELSKMSYSEFEKEVAKEMEDLLFKMAKGDKNTFNEIENEILTKKQELLSQNDHEKIVLSKLSSKEMKIDNDERADTETIIGKVDGDNFEIIARSNQQSIPYFLLEYKNGKLSYYHNFAFVYSRSTKNDYLTALGNSPGMSYFRKGKFYGSTHGPSLLKGDSRIREIATVKVEGDYELDLFTKCSALYPTHENQIDLYKLSELMIKSFIDKKDQLKVANAVQDFTPHAVLNNTIDFLDQLFDFENRMNYNLLSVKELNGDDVSNFALSCFVKEGFLTEAEALDILDHIQVDLIYTFIVSTYNYILGETNKKISFHYIQKNISELIDFWKYNYNSWINYKEQLMLLVTKLKEIKEGVNKATGKNSHYYEDLNENLRNVQGLFPTTEPTNYWELLRICNQRLNDKYKVNDEYVYYY